MKKLPESLGIYGIYNKLTDEWYVGQSNCIRRRLKSHHKALRKRRHRNYKLQKAFNKYGEDAFKVIILKLVSFSKNLSYARNRVELRNILNPLEQHFIDIYDCVECGYNIAPIAGTSLGYKHTRYSKGVMRKKATKRCRKKKWRRKLSRQGRKNWRNKKYRSKQIKSRKGKKRSRRDCNKTSKTMAKRWQDPTYHARTTKAICEAQANPKYHKKLSASQKAAWAEPGEKERRSKIARDSWTPAKRKQQSEILKEACSTEEAHQRKSMASKRMWSDPEYRETQSASRRKEWRTKSRQAKVARGWHHSAASRVRIRNSLLGHTVSKITRQRISQSLCA